MLVLGRKKGQSILIGENIEITIQEINRDFVKLAINAPKEIEIMRSELKEIIDDNKKAMKEVKPSDLKGLLKQMKMLESENHNGNNSEPSQS